MHIYIVVDIRINENINNIYIYEHAIRCWKGVEEQVFSLGLPKFYLPPILLPSLAW